MDDSFPASADRASGRIFSQRGVRLSLTPKVSVLMPVFNGEKYLREAIDSILKQSFTEFEFIIINDGSTDRSAEILQTYADPRLRVIHNESNIGVTLTLNKGLDLARGEYVARMDCDDVSVPDRLEKQVSFMDAHPEVAVCGTYALVIDETGRVLRTNQVPTGRHLEVDYWRLNPIIHPSAMIRVGHLGDLRYDGRIRYAQDFDLWLRIKAKHDLHNIPEYLLLYRRHGDSITRSKNEAQRSSAYRIFCAHLEIDRISYDEWLSLSWRGYHLNPVSRALLTARIARKIRQPYRAYLKGDFRYALRWFSHRRQATKQWIKKNLRELRAV